MTLSLQEAIPLATGICIAGLCPWSFTLKPILIYFFAPWCPYCSASADNINRLRRLRSEERLAIIIVALDWQERDQILEYAYEHELNVPVIMGNSEIARDWKVQGFPTY